MKTDVPLKVLFRLRPQDLLALTGDGDAEVLSADVVELQEVRRSVDFVLRLTAGGETYLRHLEFQAEPDPDMLERCFRYNALMTLEYHLPVLTTIVYLFPPGSLEPPVYRIQLGNREVNRWQFECLKVWELDAAEALASSGPGVLALVPLMKGGEDLGLIEEAGRRIGALAPEHEQPDLFAILHLLAGRRYTDDVLRRLIGRKRMIDFQSSLIDEFFAKGEAQGAAKGRVEGHLDAERDLCAELVRKYHPALAEIALPIIEVCDDVSRLKTWILSATDVDDDGFARLLREL